jgi:hypothetical protein
MKSSTVEVTSPQNGVVFKEYFIVKGTEVEIVTI